jgi:hypothetical protein
MASVSGATSGRGYKVKWRCHILCGLFSYKSRDSMVAGEVHVFRCGDALHTDGGARQEEQPKVRSLVQPAWKITWRNTFMSVGMNRHGNYVADLHMLAAVPAGKANEQWHEASLGYIVRQNELENIDANPIPRSRN